MIHWFEPATLASELADSLPTTGLDRVMGS